MKGMRTWLMAVMLAGVAFQGSPDVRAQEAKRREELGKVLDRINDPDPLLRIAVLEEVLARGNATEVQLAIKSALNGSDPDLKSLAMRGYAANLRDLYLDSSVPKEVQAALEQADDKDRGAAATRSAISEWRQATGDRLHVRLEKMDAKTGRFTAYGMNRLNKPDDRTAGDGHIVGTRLRMSIGILSLRRCVIELAPSSALMLEGSATCDNMPKMLLSMPMY